MRTSQCTLNLVQVQENENLSPSKNTLSVYTPIDPDTQIKIKLEDKSRKPESSELVEISLDLSLTENEEQKPKNGKEKSMEEGDHYFEETDLFQRIIYEAPYRNILCIPESTLRLGLSEVLSTSTQHINGSRSKKSQDKSASKVHPNQNQNNNDKCQAEFQWLDPDLISVGRAFVQRHFFSVFIAHLVAIAFLFTVKPIQALLLRTVKGGIHQEKYSIRRHLNTVLMIKRWYETDLIQDPSIIISARKKLQNAGLNFKRNIPPPAEEFVLNQSEEFLLLSLKSDLLSLKGMKELNVKSQKDKIFQTVNPVVPMSQYELAIVQFAFYGLISLYPKLFGIFYGKARMKKELAGFLHLWALIGKLLGIEDQFNLCLTSNYSYDTNQLIFKRIFLYSFTLADNIVIKLLKTLSNGAARAVMPIRSYKILLFFMSRNVARIKPSKSLQKSLNYLERFIVMMQMLTLNWLLRLRLFRYSFNLSLKMVIFLSNSWYFKLRKKNVIKERSIDISVIYGSKDVIDYS